ncbi:DUF397 domain-containing protein [Streptomyces sp. NPDC006527]|uniref:DUF397 domain-containing protein n=1 Tax=Streptomyces sp. NPDC006527 TaxID=3364749 RepID=UPI00369D4A6B
MPRCDISAAYGKDLLHMHEDRCVTWRKSSYSEQQCVEVAQWAQGAQAVRDSKRRSGPVLTFGAPAWSRFVGSLSDQAARRP